MLDDARPHRAPPASHRVPPFGSRKPVVTRRFGVAVSNILERFPRELFHRFVQAGTQEAQRRQPRTQPHICQEREDASHGRAGLGCTVNRDCGHIRVGPPQSIERRSRGQARGRGQIVRNRGVLMRRRFELPREPTATARPRDGFRIGVWELPHCPPYRSQVRGCSGEHWHLVGAGDTVQHLADRGVVELLEREVAAPIPGATEHTHPSHAQHLQSGVDPPCLLLAHKHADLPLLLQVLLDFRCILPFLHRFFDEPVATESTE
mmetsp:Transcript_44113/g.86262  ORF Transcript_44113/g.86262 Transcript_44113/m.86262 type:complete len:263 (+) Transcript_44113:247-1035(+)